jgi:choline dehydrogenase-like flavoprotein
MLKMPLIFYSLGPVEIERLRKGIALAARAFLASGAERIYLPVHGWEQLSERADLARFEAARLDPTDFEVAAFHPLGTCPMGRDPRSSVLDPWGETHDVPGLWVVDGSMLPGATGVNPQVTIMAFATRAAEALARRLGS